MILSSQCTYNSHAWMVNKKTQPHEIFCLFYTRYSSSINDQIFSNTLEGIFTVLTLYDSGIHFLLLRNPLLITFKYWILFNWLLTRTHRFAFSSCPVSGVWMFRKWMYDSCTYNSSIPRRKHFFCGKKNKYMNVWRLFCV